VRLGVALDANRRVLLDGAVRGVGELVLVALGLARDRDGVDRLQRYGAGELQRSGLVGEGVAGLHIGQLGDRAEVAVRELGHRLVVLADKREQLMEALVVACALVHQVDVGPHAAACHTEVADLADEGVGVVLVDVRRRRSAGAVFDAGTVGGRHTRPVQWGRARLAHELQQAVEADAPGRGSDHDGKRLAGSDSLAERPEKLLGVDLLVPEVALHECLVRLDDGLDGAGVRLLRGGSQLVGNGLLGHAGIVVVAQRRVREDVDHAGEVVLLAEGQVQRSYPAPERVRERLDGLSDRRALAVDLVDEDHARQVEVGRHLPDDLVLDLDTLDRADHEHDEVGHRHRGLHLADEVRVAGRIEEVHLVALPLDRRRGQRHREALLLLLVLEVEHGRAVLDAPDPVGATRQVEQCLGERRLARAPVPREQHVSDAIRWIRLHWTPSWSWCLADGGPPPRGPRRA